MKKVLLMVLILVSLLSFPVSRAQAASTIKYAGSLFVVGKGTVFVFSASGFRNRDLRNVSIYVGSNFHNLSCSANQGDKKIVCVIRGGISDEYGGETGIIHLGGQLFYVTIPSRIERIDPEEEGGSGESGCAEPTVSGADVEFTDIDQVASTEFVPGDSLDEVTADAQDQVSTSMGDLIGFKVVSDLKCGEEAPEEPAL
jgi:hypothetical protein